MSQGFFTAVDAMSDKEERDPFLETLESSGSDPSLLKNRPRSSWRTVLTVTPWLISACLGVWVLVLHSELNNGAAVFGSYESGFDTDIIPAAQIPMEQIRFRGSPQYDVNGTGFLNPVDKAAPWPENMELFGPPTPEIDSNWDQLIGNRYFSVSEAEAESAWGEKRHEYVDERKGGYTAGLELFHTLHCVNALRKGLHSEYYHSKHKHGPFHLEHCLDAIRQTIQCYGSTTLIPTKFREGIEHNYIDSDQLHTCRSFNSLRDFSTSRQRRHANYVKRDRSLLDPRKHEMVRAWKAAQRHKKHTNHE